MNERQPGQPEEGEQTEMQPASQEQLAQVMSKAIRTFEPAKARVGADLAIEATIVKGQDEQEVAGFDYDRVDLYYGSSRDGDDQLLADTGLVFTKHIDTPQGGTEISKAFSLTYNGLETTSEVRMVVMDKSDLAQAADALRNASPEELAEMSVFGPEVETMIENEDADRTALGLNLNELTVGETQAISDVLDNLRQNPPEYTESYGQ